MKTIDLGRKPEKMPETAAVAPSQPPTPDVYYPTLYLSNIEGLNDLPEEGTATVRFKVRSRTVSTRAGKSETSVDLDVLSLSEISGSKKTKSSREESEEALKKLAEEEEED